MSVTKVQSLGALTGGVRCREATLRWTEAGQRRDARVRGRAVIGSSSSAQIVVAHPTVSRLHAEVELRGDALWIRDLGSRNGTFVNGVFVADACVSDRATIALGSATLSVMYGAATEPTDLWPEGRLGPLVGPSVAMRRLFAEIVRVAAADAPVFIRGETGTGKELIAEAVHGNSRRAGRPYVVVDCAALPDNLIESELFGHARGAFTGATSSRVGAIEAAHGGTVFLDEIGELPLALQSRLLRVVESRTVRRVGETESRSVDVRFVSATHRDVHRMVNAGAFREDLYFRLAVLPLAVPPLRDRPEDVAALVESFLPGDIVASPELLRELSERPWLGNVRELRNFVTRAQIVGAGAALGTAPSDATDDEPATKSDVPPNPSRTIDITRDFRAFRAEWEHRGEKAYLARLLARNDRNVVAAAQEARVDRTHLYRLLRKHGM